MSKQSIGALWRKQVKGKDMFTGTIEINGQKVKVAVWPNDYKKEEKHPDFKIFVDDYEPKQPYAVGNAAGKLSDSNGVSLNSDMPF